MLTPCLHCACTVLTHRLHCAYTVFTQCTVLLLRLHGAYRPLLIMLCAYTALTHLRIHLCAYTGLARPSPPSLYTSPMHKPYAQALCTGPTHRPYDQLTRAGGFLEKQFSARIRPSEWPLYGPLFSNTDMRRTEASAGRTRNPSICPPCDPPVREGFKSTNRSSIRHE